MHESIFSGISSHRKAIAIGKMIKINKFKDRFPKPKIRFRF